MKPSSNSRSINYYSLTTAVLALALISILNSSCRKTWIEPRSIYDKNFFFTTNINGKTYTTYAWRYRYRPLVNDTPSVSGVFTIRTSPTPPYTWPLSISVRPDSLDANLQVSGTCGAAISLTRTGDLLGTYSVDGSNNILFGIDGRTYRIDSTAAVFNLTYLSPPGTAEPVVEGNFQCTCYDQSTKVSFAATGSFRLKAK